MPDVVSLPGRPHTATPAGPYPATLRTERSDPAEHRGPTPLNTVARPRITP
ncbi:hypothetical protein BJ965_003906 [Streptomyces luteogriseus]|uniref:Uncharacterized protein n=1 Tax=Streptomyces luteogriseus TaxID=68233 RepID=A0A7W7DNI4_9ACTN|nr:hypothetical protein [Streptomyces luteogriseus]